MVAVDKVENETQEFVASKVERGGAIRWGINRDLLTFTGTSAKKLSVTHGSDQEGRLRTQTMSEELGYVKSVMITQHPREHAG